MQARVRRLRRADGDAGAEDPPPGGRGEDMDKLLELFYAVREKKRVWGRQGQGQDKRAVVRGALLQMRDADKGDQEADERRDDEDVNLDTEVRLCCCVCAGVFMYVCTYTESTVITYIHTYIYTYTHTNI